MSKKVQKHNVYLIVADETREFEHALRYAARAAAVSKAKIGILHIMPQLDFVHWGNVEDRIREEQRRNAEAFIVSVSSRLNEIQPQCPCVFLEEGSKIDAVSKTLKENSSITKLILGAHSENNSPGELVIYFAGKGVGELHAPLTIVPDHLSYDQIDNVL